jgi:hypothetical protein
LALALPLGASERLRLPWIFSDEPDLSADFGFEPGAKGATSVDLELGGRFAGFGLPANAASAPKLELSAEFTAPSELERDVRVLKAQLDLAEVLQEYGLHFERRHFSSASKLVYKSSLQTELPPGDYNVRLTLQDRVLGVESRRTLHLIVPAMEGKQWQVGDLKFITAVGKRLDEKGHAQRVLDGNPWRQVGADLGWDLLVAYNDVGPRPKGALKRLATIHRLRGDQTPIWQDPSDPAPKKASQVWLLRVPEAQVKAWKAGIYVLEVELSVGERKVSASKTFEVLP